MVNNCVVQGCVVGTAKQNVTLREFPKASRQDASCGGAFRIDDSKRLGSRRVTPMCAVHTLFLLTLLTMSNTIGFAKKRVINKTAVPTMSPSKRAVSQRSLSQPLDAEDRLGLAAGPDSERRTPVNSLRKLKYRRISHMDHHIKYLCYLPDS